MLDEVVHSVCDIWQSTQVGVRISPNGVFNDMGSEDYRELYLYVASQLNKCNLAYLHVMDGLGFGFHELGTPMTLSEFRAVFTNPIIGNVGYTKESAENEISEGNADLVAFGRPFISNPDLVNRFKHNIQLNPEADISTWYTPAGAEGYIDFPTAE
jgi:N-ethylmaleimide reductase